LAFSLSRHRFLTGASAAIAVAGSGTAARAAQQFAYKAAHDFPTSHPLHIRMVQLWDAVKRETNGRLSVTVYPNSILGGQTALFSQLRAGAIDFLATNSGVYAEVVPPTGIDSVGFAFSSPKQPWTVFDGPLGEMIRREFAAKNLFAFRNPWDIGLRQVTSSKGPIKSVDDFSGFKIRTPASKIALDLFRTLGAAPTPMSFSELYTSLQTHIVDGQESPYLTIDAFRIFEVQKYLSVTNHMWTGYWTVANGDSWKALPADVQGVVVRNMAKYVKLERNDVLTLNQSLTEKLRGRGLAINVVDTKTMRARLRPYYARWKGEFGNAAWGMLEAQVGKLG
jgi:tripartite ATP-independent transporter DctP family solute receptor